LISPLKKTFHPKEQEREDVKIKRENWAKNQSDLPLNNLVFLDESSINLAYTRLYGRAKSNQRINEGIKDVRFQRQSILSTIRLSGEQVPFIFEGTLNKELFAEYVKKILSPTLNLDDIVVFDNCSVHHAKLVAEALTACGVNVLFLPPYSPDFNPIELMWAYVKKILKKLKARTYDTLTSSLDIALYSVK
jgi:transposase